MNIDKGAPDAEAFTRALERGFNRVMAALANADDRERERLLRIVDTADQAHDAYANVGEPNEQDNAAVQLLHWADAYNVVGTRELDQNLTGPPETSARPTIPDVDGTEPSADSAALAVATRVDGPVEPPDEVDDGIDFSFVHADDAFLDALGVAEPHPEGKAADDRLAALLLSWRQDVDAEPLESLVDPKLAVATVCAARIRQRRGSRLLAPLAAAAALLAIVFSGVGMAARDAQPGDALWGLTRVLYVDHARSVEAAQAVRSDLTRAEEALANGNVAEAKTTLDEARHALSIVANEDGKDDLHAQLATLDAKLSNNAAISASSQPTTPPHRRTS